MACVEGETMASPEILDFELLLAPIPGDNPAGEDLRADPAYDSVYRQIRTARDKARTTEINRISGDDENPDWKPILQLAPQALAEKSKDLTLVAFLTEALVRAHGCAGLRDGFRLARELAERFWDGLHPMPDEDGMITRVAPLTGLNGEDKDGVLIAPIFQVLITQGNTCGPYDVFQYRKALEIEGIDDPEKKARLQDEPGAVSKAMFDAAVSETSPDFARNLLEDLTAAADEFTKLCEVLEEKCGKDESGYPTAPPSSTIRHTLEDFEDYVRTIYRNVLELDEEEGEESEGGKMVEVGPGGDGVPSRVQTREEAFRALLRAAEFFKRTEPHSPVSYALEQAVRWGRMPLPELWTELIPDLSTREHLFRMVGIKPPEENA
jgi:type VI secretion system protein ImpA